MPVMQTEQRPNVQKGAGNLTQKEVDERWNRDAGGAGEVNVSYWDFVTHLRTVAKITINEAREWWQSRR